MTALKRFDGDGHDDATPVRRRMRIIRLGVAEGRFPIPDDIDGDNAAIARLFYGEEVRLILDTHNTALATHGDRVLLV